MRGDSMKDVVVVPSPWFFRRDSGMLLSAVMWLGHRSAHVNVALRRGSSQPGKQRRASMLSNCVDAMSFLLPSMSVYVDR